VHRPPSPIPEVGQRDTVGRISQMGRPQRACGADLRRFSSNADCDKNAPRCSITSPGQDSHERPSFLFQTRERATVSRLAKVHTPVAADCSTDRRIPSETRRSHTRPPSESWACGTAERAIVAGFYRSRGLIDHARSMTASSAAKASTLTNTARDRSAISTLERHLPACQNDAARSTRTPTR